MSRAAVSEVFTSIQGEGLYLGVPQLFIRLAGCNLDCPYCDRPADGRSREYDLPGLLDEVARCRSRSRLPSLHSVSLTGGEPLCQASFLRSFLPGLRETGLPAYLETNGTLPGELDGIIELVDYAAVDFKPPPVSLPGGGDCFGAHRLFLSRCLEHLAPPRVFIKVVAGPGATAAGIRRAAELCRELDRSLALVLQPAVDRAGRFLLDRAEILSFFIAAAEIHPGSRLVPPAHQRLGLR